MVFHSTISLPKEVPVLKISEDVSACDLWFAPPPNQKSWVHLCCQSYSNRIKLKVYLNKIEKTT